MNIKPLRQWQTINNDKNDDDRKEQSIMNNDENKNDKKTEGDDYVFDFGREEKNDGQAGR